jgi:hypothetical protein
MTEARAEKKEGRGKAGKCTLIKLQLIQASVYNLYNLRK